MSKLTDSVEQLKLRSTQQLKQQLLELTQERDRQPLKQKVQFYQEQLAPIVTELSQRNPYPQAEDQTPLVLGVWMPVWSTIPFQDILPGRLREQSYQIFQDSGFYANIARYAPGSQLKLGWGLKLASFLFALDLIVLQRYAVEDGQWQIENIDIKQTLRWSGRPLSMEKATSWLAKIVQNYQRRGTGEDASLNPQLKNLNRRAAKRLETAFESKPQFEHLYIDRDFRVVKSRREAKQRPSYTIAVRKK